VDSKQTNVAPRFMLAIKSLFNDVCARLMSRLQIKAIPLQWQSYEPCSVYLTIAGMRGR